MATIETLHPSISAMSNDELYSKLRDIRNNRLRRPEKKVREAKAPAKVKRKPNPKAPKQQDLFALAGNMTDKEKAALAAKLLGGNKS